MADPNAVTPMMAQFLEIKGRYPDALLFYRMGDFYELFFADAEAAAAALDISLTKRGKHLGEDIPMCGVPVHAAEGYLLTLIRKGFRVAVCEQLEDPAEAKKRGSKSVVKRDVVRLVTPGTLTEDSLLAARQNNFLAAWTEVRGEGAIAWVDISTGDLRVKPCSRAELSPELARLAPREVLISHEDSDAIRPIAEDLGVVICERARADFDSLRASETLSKLFGATSVVAFGEFEKAETGALGAIAAYLEVTGAGRLPRLSPPRKERPGGVMVIDAATRRNLELTMSNSGGRAGSLLATVDHTLTGVGARLLSARLSSPSTDLETIGERLDSVSFFGGNASLRADIRSVLQQAPDFERAVSRLALERAGPRDLGAIRDGLAASEDLAARLNGHDLPKAMSAAAQALKNKGTLLADLQAALVAEPPVHLRDGGFVQSGYDTGLDEARKLRDESRGVVAQLEGTYRETTGIQSLKVKHNNVLGYFIETPATHAEKMLSEPLSDAFRHRQTTANAVRFSTTELTELESAILNAGFRALEIEKSVFGTLRDAVLAKTDEVLATAKALAEIDVAAAFSHLATNEDWCRPDLCEEPVFEVSQGRHPVVEASLKRSGDQFIPNDCALLDGENAGRLWLLTGPNMAGKSTFLRQNALIAILAQAGSFVPAERARIGVVDQVFSRVGAADDLARGRSTFMVEMVETAAILNQAGPRALVILDEIGRGTATHDGLAIAWATLEHLHDANSCRALFATHYHELTELSGRLASLRNATVTVKEWDGNVVFLHEVRPGAADRSYGVQVARLAGLPLPVIERARDILERLEEAGRTGQGAGAIVDDLPLFSAVLDTPKSASAPMASPVLDRLKDISPDALTPREALDLIYEFKALADE